MTPYELNLYIQNYNEKKKASDDEKLILTYLGAYWTRVKRMPSLKSIIKVPQKKMTPEEILAKVKAMNAKFGGDVY